MQKKKAAKTKNSYKKFESNCACKDVIDYTKDVLEGRIRVSKEVKQQVFIVKNEFQNGKIFIDLEQYEKYIAIGLLFFKGIFPYQKYLTAVALCTYIKGTRKPRWNKFFLEMGRGNGKDGIIAWWSCCLTSAFHGVQHYDVDIIANNYDQSLRPIIDIQDMAEEKGKTKFYSKLGDSIVSFKTKSYINARSSDAKMQDGLRSGAVVFNEIHVYQNYSKLNVMISGLGKIDDPRVLYFTTNGETRGQVLDDMIDTAHDVLNGLADDRRTLYFIYKLNAKEDVSDPDNWIMANPSLPFRETLKDEIEDEYAVWSRNPQNFPAFLQKRMNLPEMPTDQEVVSWETILKTTQDYDYSRLEGKPCVVGIDLSKTTDWTAVNMLFYDSELDKYVCINHAFICGQNRDLNGIKAPVQEWCNQGFGTIINSKEVDPKLAVDFAISYAQQHNCTIEHFVIDDFRKGIMSKVLEDYGYSKDMDNVTLTRPSNIAPTVPIIERMFINEKLIWNNPVLRWATNNTKLVAWKNQKTTGDNDMGNQLYGKINPRFRKTDPFMAFVHSFVKADVLDDYGSLELYERGF